MNKIYILFTIILLGFGCQNHSEQAARTVSMEFFNSGPQLVKIPLKDSAITDSLIHLGMDVIVIEKDYIIARLENQDVARVQTMSLNMETFTEEELVQRLITVVMKEKSDLRELSDIGIDIWQVRGDTVVAQAYDKYIRQIQEKGYSVEIVENNILDIVKKESAQ